MVEQQDCQNFSQSQNKIKLYSLPNSVILEIAKFLKIKDIYRGLAQCNKLLNNFFDEHNSRQIILKSFHTAHDSKWDNFFKLQGKNQLKDYFQRHLQQKINLPYWGFQLNSGVYSNSLRFWIGKAFMKSQGQRVCFQKDKNIDIFACLSQEQIDFQDMIEKMAQLQKDTFNIEELQTKISQIEIFKIFNFAFQLEQNLTDILDQHGQTLGEVQLNKFYEIGSRMYNYVNSMSKRILENCEINNANQQVKIALNPQKLYKQKAVIQQIKFNRKGKFNKQAKTVMIFCKNSNKPVSQLDKDLLTFFDDCSNREILSNKIQNKNFNIHKSTEINSVDFTLFKKEQTDKNNLYPFIWFQFKDYQQLQFKLNLSYSEQNTTKIIVLKIIDFEEKQNNYSDSDEENYYMQNGVLNCPGFSYCNFKGHILNFDISV